VAAAAAAAAAAVGPLNNGPADSKLTFQSQKIFGSLKILKM